MPANGRVMTVLVGSWAGCCRAAGPCWPSDSLQTISLRVPLQPITEGGSPLVFFPGSQHHWLIEQPLPSDRWPEPIGTAPPVVAAPPALGDATLQRNAD